MGGKRVFDYCILFCLSLCFMVPVSSLAQEEFTLEDITVTAERRETLQQETPVALSVVTGNTLDNMVIRKLEDITIAFPGLTWSAINRAQGRLQFRGMQTGDDSAGTDQSLGYFVDGIYFGRMFALNQSLPDVQQVELLRGPQGTLWGHNVVAGSLNVTTKDPTDEFEAKIHANLGNYNRMDFGGMISGPIVEGKVLGLFSFFSENMDGYIDNLETGNKLNGTDRQSARGKIKLFPSNNVDIEFDMGLEYNRSPGHATITMPGSTPATLYTWPGIEQTGAGRDGSMDSDMVTSRLEINWELANGLTFSSLTGYWTFEQTLNDYSWFNLPLYLGGAFVDAYYDNSQFTQEFRLMNDPTSRLRWQGGLYYYKADDTKTEDWIEYMSSDPAYPNVVTDVFMGGAYGEAMVALIDQHAKAESYAAFFQGTYALLDWLNFTAGARYTYVEKSTHTYNFGDHPVFIEPDAQPGYIIDHEVDWDEITPKFTLDALFKDTGAFDSLLFYGTAGKGWKAGGYNPGTSPQAAMNPFRPESVWSYEVGAKTTLLDNRMNFNLAAFRAEYTDHQTITVDTAFVGGTGVTAYNASMTCDGIEVDGIVWLTEWLRMSFGYAYYDSTYDEGSEIADEDVSGKRTVMTPEHSLNIGWNMQFPAGNLGTLLFDGMYAYHDELFIDHSNTLVDLIPGTSEHTKMEELTARVALTNGNWEVSLWGRNLLDTFQVFDGGDTAGLFAYTAPEFFSGAAMLQLQRNVPRTYGVTFEYKW